jgi:hypothetical protein
MKNRTVKNKIFLSKSEAKALFCPMAHNPLEVANSFSQKLMYWTHNWLYKNVVARLKITFNLYVFVWPLANQMVCKLISAPGIKSTSEKLNVYKKINSNPKQQFQRYCM